MQLVRIIFTNATGTHSYLRMELIRIHIYEFNLYGFIFTNATCTDSYLRIKLVRIHIYECNLYGFIFTNATCTDSYLRSFIFPISMLSVKLINACVASWKVRYEFNGCVRASLQLQCRWACRKYSTMRRDHLSRAIQPFIVGGYFSLLFNLDMNSDLRLSWPNSSLGVPAAPPTRS